MGRGLGVGTNLGVGVCLGVAVDVGVGVTIAVGVAETVAVGVGGGETVAVDVGVGEGVPVGVGVGVGADSMVRTTSFVSYVTCAVTPAGAVIETFEKVVPFRPPFAVKRVYCIPTIKGLPVSVTFKFPSSPAMPPTITLPATSGITVADMIAVESKVRSPVMEIIESGVSVP